MLKIKITLIVLLFLFASTINAHEDHKKKEQDKPDTLTIVGGDTIAINGIATDQYISEQIDTENYESESSEEEKTKEVTLGAAFEHIHNKVIHFPIALTVVGLLLMILGYKENKYWNALKIIIPFTALFSIVAIISGLNQAEPFEGTAAYELVETHELLGFGVVASLILWSLSLYVKQLKKLVWLFAGLALILVSIAGLYGGVIAH